MYLCPCDAQLPKSPVEENLLVMAMNFKPVSDDSLSNKYDAARSSEAALMPDDIDAGDISDVVQVQLFQQAPVARPALDPGHVH